MLLATEPAAGGAPTGQKETVMTITLSHGGPTMYRSSARSRHVLVGTIQGVVDMERDGDSPGWHVARRTLTGEHIHALLIEPESGTIFAGVNHGSIFASLDDGRTWERRDQGLTEQDVYSLACARLPSGPRIFAGTEPAHLFGSDDLGRSWVELPALRAGDTSRWTFPAPPNVAHTKHIAVHPHDPQTVFVGVEQGGLLKSTDAGRTFRVIPGMDEDVHRTVINPRNPDEIFVTTGVGMYVTADGGKTWEQWTDQQHEIGGYPDLLVHHPRQPELMFIASAEQGPGTWFREHYAGSRISRSADGGRTWRAVPHGFPDQPLRTAFEAMSLEDWGDSFSLFGATATGEVWCSDDGGEHWSEVLRGLAPISKGPHYKAFMAA
jgi:photosystem II stability/assembly factor-like uncharacterized protein